MNSVNRFFLFCSGVEISILEKCPSDKNKYVGIGATVFFTGILAFFSSAYALFTVFDSAIAALLFGLIWGLMIFNLDRYIVSSMKSLGSWWRDFFIAAPRLLLAVLLALVISKPLELKIFEKEIDSELIGMKQEVFKNQENLVKARFDGQIANYESQIAELKKEISIKTSARDTLAKIAQMEADGTGGSMSKNLGPIYKTKKANADLAQVELDNLIAFNLPLISEKEGAIKELESQIQTDIAALDREAFGGLAARMEALERLGSQSSAIWMANLFVMLLFVAVETAPIFVKLISSQSPYDFVLNEHEHNFKMAHLERTSLLSNSVKNLVLEKTEITTHSTKAKITEEKAKINADLKRRMEQLKKEHGSLDALTFDI